MYKYHSSSPLSPSLSCFSASQSITLLEVNRKSSDSFISSFSPLNFFIYTAGQHSIAERPHHLTTIFSEPITAIMQFTVVALLSLVAVAFASPVAQDLVARSAEVAAEAAAMTDASGNVVAFNTADVYLPAAAAGH